MRLVDVSKFVFVFLAFFAPWIASAQSTYTLLAPLPGLTTVTLTVYLEGIVRVTIGVAGILAVIMIVICGIQMIGSPSVSQKSESKECIWNAILGLLLAIGSWVILNTINEQLLRSDFTPPLLPTPASISPAAARTDPTPTAPGCYFRYRDIRSGHVTFSRQNTCAMCENIRTQFQADTDLIEVQTACFQVGGGAPPAAPTPTTPPPPLAPGDVRCTQSGLNLHEPIYQQCWNGDCARFRTLVSGKAADPRLIMAVILQESSCGQQLVGDQGESCGPMHITVPTANRFRSRCGVSEVLTCGWLSAQANWDAAICMSAEYLNSLSGACGSPPENLYAGYNGGAGACASSANCSGLRRWECLYDDNAHQICNAGYFSLRNAAPRVNYCTINPGSTGY